MKRSTQAKMHMKSLREARGTQKRLIPVDTDAEIRLLNTQVQACKKCGLCELKENNIESGCNFGKLVLNNLHKTIFKSTVLFVAINPSHRRFDSELRAFRGVDDTVDLTNFKTSGDLFKLAIEKSDIRDYDIWIDNCVHCSTEENIVPTKEQIDCCFDWLFREIELLSPKLIVAMGQESFNILNERIKGKRLVRIWHPAACMYKGKDSINEFVQQLNDLKKLL